MYILTSGGIDPFETHTERVDIILKDLFACTVYLFESDTNLSSEKLSKNIFRQQTFLQLHENNIEIRHNGLTVGS